MRMRTQFSLNAGIVWRTALIKCVRESFITPWAVEPPTHTHLQRTPILPVVIFHRYLYCLIVCPRSERVGWSEHDTHTHRRKLLLFNPLRLSRLSSRLASVSLPRPSCCSIITCQRIHTQRRTRAPPAAHIKTILNLKLDQNLNKTFFANKLN